MLKALAAAFTSPQENFMLLSMKTVDATLWKLSLLVLHKNQVKLRLDLVGKNLLSTNQSLNKLLRLVLICILVAMPTQLTFWLTQSKISRFLKERVIGSGNFTWLSSFRQALAETIGVDARSVHAYIMGEHGDQNLLLLVTIANVAGVKLSNGCSQPRLKWSWPLLNSSSQFVTPLLIINKKVLHNTVLQLLCSYHKKLSLMMKMPYFHFSLQEGQYGVENVFIGQPIVGAHGIVRR